MDDTERKQIKPALLKCAKENENKGTFTGYVIVSSVCRAAVERIEELEKENEQLRADYDKQKEINKELVDDMADLHKRIRQLETQIKQMNEREAQDIRARFPC